MPLPFRQEAETVIDVMDQPVGRQEHVFGLTPEAVHAQAAKPPPVVGPLDHRLAPEFGGREHAVVNLPEGDQVVGPVAGKLFGQQVRVVRDLCEGAVEAALGPVLGENPPDLVRGEFKSWQDVTEELLLLGFPKVPLPGNLRGRLAVEGEPLYLFHPPLEKCE